MSWNDTVIDEFRAGHERIADTFDRDNLVILHTTGSKSGEQRVAPVACFDVDGSPYVIASAAGSPKHPSWFTNLVAEPEVAVERWAGDRLDTFEARAVPLEGDERESMWQRIVAYAPGFGEYQKKTDRVIPVVRLDRR